MSYFLPLSKGLKTQVNRDTFYWASKYKWYAQSNGGGKFYAARTEIKKGKKRLVLLHREILKLPSAGTFDGEHKDGNSLNNLVRNLRPATRSFNHANRVKLPDDKYSRFRGVSLNHLHSSWTAQISINNHKKHLGSFRKEKDAAQAYDKAAKKQFGAFARLNFP